MDMRDQRRIGKKGQRLLTEDELEERKAYLPSPEVIAAECAAIRAEWTPGTEASRRGIRKCDDDAWFIPEVRSDVDEPE